MFAQSLAKRCAWPGCADLKMSVASRQAFWLCDVETTHHPSTRCALARRRKGKRFAQGSPQPGADYRKSIDRPRQFPFGIAAEFKMGRAAA